jgi:DNA-binding NtrC family response regulator
MGDFGELNLIGHSSAFLGALELIKRFAACEATVLVQGETGTGKELVARAIHYLGERRDFPFIPVNCGALPDSLVESEMFGHARGAFTDARDTRPGLVAEARGGTLFLDEIEALTPKAQVTLLRFVEDLEYRPVGGAIVRNANVRVIAASNTDLGGLVARGQFRQDLLFRLTVFVLELPPLREREGDAVLLARAFVRRYCRQYQKQEKELSPEAIAILRAHTWPGNVRELEHLIHREVVMDDAPLLRLDKLHPARAESPADNGALTGRAFREAKAHAIESFEKAYITELLARTRGNVSLAARLCGKERSRLGKLMRKHGLQRSLFSG